MLQNVLPAQEAHAIWLLHGREGGPKFECTRSVTLLVTELCAGSMSVGYKSKAIGQGIVIRSKSRLPPSGDLQVLFQLV